LAAVHRLHEPVPIPGGGQAGGQIFHVFGPGLNDNPPDQEPATITDFNGFIGLAYLNGMVTQTNEQTGETQRLPFLTSDTTLPRQASRPAALGLRLSRRGLWRGWYTGRQACLTPGVREHS
jgi:hypothetical protein